MDLVVIRELNNAELNKTRSANQLLTRLANAVPYSDLVDLLAELKNTFARKSSLERTVIDANRIIRALGKAASDFVEAVKRDILTTLVGTDGADKLSDNVEAEIARPAFRFLMLASALERGPFVAASNSIVLDLDATELLTCTAGSDASNESFLEIAHDAVVIAQRIMGFQLQVYGSRISEASMWLRNLAAEVPDGIPLIIQSDRLDFQQEPVSRSSATVLPLALPAGIHLHRALRYAQIFLVETHSLFENQPLTDAGPPAEEPAEPRGQSKESVAPHSSVTSSTITDNKTSMSVTDDSPEQPEDTSTENLHSSEFLDEPIDWKSLVGHTTDMVSELERAWSSALQPEALAAAHAEIEARFTTLFAAIQRRADATDQALRISGVNMQYINYPLSVDQVDAITLDPTVDQLCRQLELAQLAALQGLLEALEGIRNPSARRITLPDNTLETWWEAGAFQLVRARAEQLIRIVEALRTAQASLLEGASTRPNISGFFDHIKLAHRALQQGDAEGCLIHSNIALRSRCELEYADLPHNLLEHLAAQPQLIAHEPLLLKLENATMQLAKGLALDPGVALLLAGATLELVTQLCFARSNILHDIFRGDDADGS